MSSDNPTADRLVEGARKKEAAQQSPLLAKIGIVLGALGVIDLPLGALPLIGIDFLGGAVGNPYIGWALGAVAVILGGISLQRGAATKLAKIALVVGVASILVATFFFTWSTALSS